MYNAPHHDDLCLAEETGLIRRITLLVVYLFMASLLSLSLTSMAFADDERDHYYDRDRDRDRDGGGGGGGGNDPKVDFVIPMNYELGMHCTGFEFAYCCVLPAYNSILAQVIKTQDGNDDFAELLEGDPNVGKDFLGRETVLRDKTLRNGQFQKYVLKYKHFAQPRNGEAEGGLISNVELNSLLSWNTVFDAATVDPRQKVCNADDTDTEGQQCTSDADCGTGSCIANPYYNALITGEYHGARNVVMGDGDYQDDNDNYQNGVWNHLYFYADLEGTRLCAAGKPSSVTCHEDKDCDAVEGDGSGVCGDSTEANKIRLGMPNASRNFPAIYPVNSGPAFHPMGPDGSDLNNVLTFSTDDGTVVFTQMKLLENLPVMLTSPRIWEALGLPLTPFEDSIGFFESPGAVDEDSIRPYVKMQATMHRFDPNASDGAGEVVLDSNKEPVIAFGTAPIDIPNCERCHSAPPARCEDWRETWPDCTGDPITNINSPNAVLDQYALVEQEVNFWKAYYPSMQLGSDWYARLKGAAISILSIHDNEHGTSFTKAYTVPGFGTTTAWPGVECTNNPDPIGDPASTDCDHGPLTINGLNPGDGARNNPLGLPQNTRLGNESVICQKCHADNVIAVVKSANCGPDNNCVADADYDPNNPPLIPALTEAIHYNHRNVSEGGNIVFNDAEGRDGGCQGCHPAHRSDGVMVEDPDDPDRYPITLDGNNAFADADNRDAAGGCFVGRDVHSNRYKDDPEIGGADTPSHLNPVGGWLYTNVAKDSGNWKGIWCTNCHSQAGQELWKAENVADHVHAQPGADGNVREPVPGDATEIAPDVLVRGGTLQDVVAAVDAATPYPVTLTDFERWLDPKNDPDDPFDDTVDDRTHAIWAPDPGLCEFLVNRSPAHDGTVATAEVAIAPGQVCSTGAFVGPVDCSGIGGPVFNICGTYDGENDFSVNLIAGGIRTSDGSFCTPPGPADTPDPDCVEQSPFCTTQDCVEAAQYLLSNSSAVAVPFSAATDGRDHWLSAGEPHCADCHAAPYVEQSGNISNYPPFNYPRKSSLMRYTRGHRDITCQGCHESIHGLYPVTPNIDTTSYAQAAQWNADDSHGPLKCQSCHRVNSSGVHDRVDELRYDGGSVERDFDRAVGWMHTFTDEHDPLQDWCQNCHEDERDKVCADFRQGGDDAYEEEWLEHSFKGRASRKLMDQVEKDLCGNVAGEQGNNENPLDTVCEGCHGDESDEVSCGERKWKEHLTEGRVSESVWKTVSADLISGQPAADGTICGW